MAIQGAVKAIIQTEINAAALLPGVLQLITDADGLAQACFMIRIVNDSNVPIFISYDRIHANDYIRANDSLNLNMTPYNFRKGLPISVAGAAGIGLITLSGYYVGA